MIVWIGKPLALAIHDRQLAEHGGSGGVRDETLLDSALARPQESYASLHVKAAVPGRTSHKEHGDPAHDLADLAASLAFGVARNHPFVDGNKRTAAVVCETFIALNGASLHADNLELYPIYLSLAEGSLDEAGFAAWLRPRIRPAAGRQVHEKRARYAR